MVDRKAQMLDSEKGTQFLEAAQPALGRGSPGALASGDEGRSSLWGSLLGRGSSPGGPWPVPWACLLPRMLYIVFLKGNRGARGWQPCHSAPFLPARAQAVSYPRYGLISLRDSRHSAWCTHRATPGPSHTSSFHHFIAYHLPQCCL